MRPTSDLLSCLRRLIGGVVLAAAVGGGCGAAAADLAAARADMAGLAAEHLGRPAATRALRSALLGRFDRADLDGGGVGASDEALRAEAAAARVRATLLAEWLAHDLDGDGAVGARELERGLTPKTLAALRKAAGTMTPSAAQRAWALEQMVAATRLPDPDRDGVSTLAEMHAAAAEAVAAGEARRAQRAPLLPESFDLDGDGTVALSEFAALADALIGRLDRDGDGFVSDLERQAIARR
ncbi:MAG: hypothetical protein AAFW46_04275 [Pseudomonadota bacterium]